MPTESSMASSVEAPCSCQITDLSKDVSYEQFFDVNAFASRSMAILQHEVCRNTLCMTQLNSLTNSSSTSVSTDSSIALAMLTCSKCSISSVITASDNKGMGYSACYVSARVCRHTTAQLSCVLQQQLQHVDKVTLTAAAANLLCEAQPCEHRWQLDHQLQLMVYSNCTNPGSDTAAKPASAAPADADSSLQLQPDQVPQLAEHQHSHLKQQQQQQGLHLRQCTAEADAALVVSWAAAFLQEVFHQPQPPTDNQVSEKPSQIRASADDVGDKAAINTTTWHLLAGADSTGGVHHPQQPADDMCAISWSRARYCNVMAQATECPESAVLLTLTVKLARSGGWVQRHQLKPVVIWPAMLTDIVCLTAVAATYSNLAVWSPRVPCLSQVLTSVMLELQ